MRANQAAGLAIIALAAWASWFLWLREVPGTDARRERAGRLLPAFEAEQVRRLTLERPGGTVELSRAASGWRVERPVQDTADRDQVESILRDLAEAKPVARVPLREVAGGDAATGLAKNATRVVIDAGRAPLVVTVGGAVLPGDRRYARVGDAPDLAIVDRALAESVARPLDDLRAHALFPFPAAEVERFWIERPGHAALVFERRAAGAWWMTSPLADAADDGLVGGALTRLLDLRALHFADPGRTDRDLGLDPPRATVRLFRADGHPLGALRLGTEAGAEGERFAAVENRAARFTTSFGGLLADLEREPGAFRSKVALEYATADVVTVEVARGGDVVRAEKRGGAQAGEASWTGTGDPAKIASLVSRFARVDARRLADGVTPAEAGLDHPLAHLTVEGKDHARLPRTTLEIGRAAGTDGVYARRTGRDVVLVIDAALAAEIDPARLR